MIIANYSSTTSLPQLYIPEKIFYEHNDPTSSNSTHPIGHTVEGSWKATEEMVMCCRNNNKPDSL